MTNKRKLKKHINFICNGLFAECIAISLYSGNKNKDNVNAVLNSIICIHKDFICRVSHLEPGMKPKTYYNNVKENFNVQVCEIIDSISSL